MLGFCVELCCRTRLGIAVSRAVGRRRTKKHGQKEQLVSVSLSLKGKNSFSRSSCAEGEVQAQCFSDPYQFLGGRVLYMADFFHVSMYKMISPLPSGNGRQMAVSLGA